MTTTHAPTTGNDLARWPLYAAVSSAVSMVLVSIGTLWGPFSAYPNTDPLLDDLGELAFLAVVIAATAGVAFGLVVRTATPATAPRRSIVLAVLGFVSLAVFWAGLASVLAGAAACLALADGRPSTRGKVVLAIAAVTVGLAVWAALAG